VTRQFRVARLSAYTANFTFSLHQCNTTLLGVPSFSPCKMAWAALYWRGPRPSPTPWPDFIIPSTLHYRVPQVVLRAQMRYKSHSLYVIIARIRNTAGCPKFFSVHNGMGCALLARPETVADIVATLKRNHTLPVTCKIRLVGIPIHALICFFTPYVHFFTAARTTTLYCFFTPVSSQPPVQPRSTVSSLLFRSFTHGPFSKFLA
jgi:hypothetical protein